VNETIQRRLIYPGILHLLGEGQMYAELPRLEAFQYQAPGDVLASQHRRLADMLTYASHHSPLYTDYLKNHSSIAPEDAVDVLSSLPFLTKQDLQTRFEDLKAVPVPGRVTSKTTGGSTGQPVTVIKDRGATARERATTWMAHGWFGIRPGDRGARFWGSPRAVGKRRLRFALADFAMNRLRFSAFGVSEPDLELYWSRCLRFQPRYFYGYVSMLELFARFIADSGKDGRRLGLGAIVTTAEILTAAQRELLGQTFGVPVQNEYGCGEVGPIAYECEAGSMHLMSENVLIELLDEWGEPVGLGEEGEIVVTDLNNRALPLLRYKIRDRAIRLKECSCGRGFPVLGSIRGRVYDQVVAPDGRSYHGEFFMYLFEDLRDAGVQFDRFRILQESPTDLRVEVQTPDTGDCRLADIVSRELGREFSQMQVQVQLVEQFDLPRSGKLRLVENKTLRPVG
jgi:phenylacetate-CoA ligase